MTQETVANQEESTPAEDKAAFESGYAGVSGEPAKPEPKEAPKEVVAEPPKEKVEEAPAAEKPTEQPKPDPVMSRLEAMEQRLRKNEGQFGAFNSSLVDIKELLKAGRAAVQAAPAANKEAIASKVDEQLKQIGTDLPDVAEAVRAARDELRAEIPKIDIEAMKAEQQKALDERVAAIQAANEERTANAVAQARVLATIDLKHEGWEDTINSAPFEAWYARQPADTQELAKSPKAAAAIRMLDLFKADQAKAQQKQEQDKANADRLARATAPKGAAAPVTASLTDQEAFERGYKAVAGG